MPLVATLRMEERTDLCTASRICLNMASIGAPAPACTGGNVAECAEGRDMVLAVVEVL